VAKTNHKTFKGENTRVGSNLHEEWDQKNNRSHLIRRKEKKGVRRTKKGRVSDRQATYKKKVRQQQRKRGEVNGALGEAYK